jgi:hydroxypyruvate reductase
VIARAIAEAVLADVIAACDPEARVRAALGAPDVAARLAGRRRFAIAIGKAALAMARGAGEVEAGVAVVPDGAGGALPAGWQLLEASHPEPDERSVAAGAAVGALVRRARPDDAVLALLSGGASALVEQPLVPLGEMVATVRAVMAAGAPIDEINAVRGALSALKAGQLALASTAPVITLAISDVIGDSLAVIGSGPTIGPWLSAPGTTVDDGAATRRARARTVLARYGAPAPAILGTDLPPHAVARTDLARVIAPMSSAAQAAVRALAARGIAAAMIDAPIAGAVDTVAQLLAAQARGTDVVAATATTETRTGTRAAVNLGQLVAWGEPTLRLPARHGVGGRAQQLALVLARLLRGGDRSALVVGTDGVDGPPPPGRPSPAGAWIDGATWDTIAARGIDPAAALAACDAGTALAAIGALVVTGPSGINHADLVVVG